QRRRQQRRPGGRLAGVEPGRRPGDRRRVRGRRRADRRWRSGRHHPQRHHRPRSHPDADTFVWIMLAALLAGALWLNIATAVGAPVSTTHSIVGAVLGSGMAAAGPAIVDWATMGNIAASWVVSPLLGGLFAAGFLYLVKRSITYQP